MNVDEAYTYRGMGDVEGYRVGHFKSFQKFHSCGMKLANGEYLNAKFWQDDPPNTLIGKMLNIKGVKIDEYTSPKTGKRSVSINIGQKSDVTVVGEPGFTEKGTYVKPATNTTVDLVAIAKNTLIDLKLMYEELFPSLKPNNEDAQMLMVQACTFARTPGASLPDGDEKQVSMEDVRKTFDDRPSDLKPGAHEAPYTEPGDPGPSLGDEDIPF